MQIDSQHAFQIIKFIATLSFVIARLNEYDSLSPWNSLPAIKIFSLSVLVLIHHSGLTDSVVYPYHVGLFTGLLYAVLPLFRSGQ